MKCKILIAFEATFFFADVQLLDVQLCSEAALTVVQRVRARWSVSVTRRGVITSSADAGGPRCGGGPAAASVPQSATPSATTLDLLPHNAAKTNNVIIFPR